MPPTTSSLSRHPIENVKRSRAPGSDLAMLEADVATPRGLVHVLVVHTHPTDPVDPKRRARLDRLRRSEVEAVVAWARRDGPVLVVLGDFNSTPSSHEYAILRDTLGDACPKAGPSWPASFPVVTIDYVWVSDAFEVLGCTSHASDASDHRPRVASLAWRG